MKRGYTLVEVFCVLVLLSLGVAAAVNFASRGGGRATVLQMEAAQQSETKTIVSTIDTGSANE